MVKYTITKAEYDLMSPEMKGHYLADRSGDTYSLSTSGENPEVTQLRSQLGEQGTQLQRAQTDLATAQHQLKQADADAEQKYKAQLDTATAQINDMRTAQSTAAREKIVDGIADKFNSPSLFKSAIRERVTAEYDDKGELVVTCHDAKGAVITSEALEKEYCTNKEYSAMLKTQSTVTIGTPTPVHQSAPQSMSGAPQSNVVYDQSGKATSVNFATASPQEIAAAIETIIPSVQ